MVCSIQMACVYVLPQCSSNSSLFHGNGHGQAALSSWLLVILFMFVVDQREFRSGHEAGLTILDYLVGLSLDQVLAVSASVPQLVFRTSNLCSFLIRVYTIIARYRDHHRQSAANGPRSVPFKGNVNFRSGSLCKSDMQTATASISDVCHSATCVQWLIQQSRVRNTRLV